MFVLQVDYEYNTSSGKMEILHGRERCMSNLSILLQWSPYSSESELLKQVRYVQLLSFPSRTLNFKVVMTMDYINCILVVAQPKLALERNVI